MKILLSFLLCALCFATGFAQVSDSIPPTASLQIDTLQIRQAEKGIVPKRALLYGIFPGGGQIYNRRWWKLPIVYGAFAGLVAVIDDNQQNYSRFQTAYQLALDDEVHEFTGTRLDSPTTLRNLRDNFDKNRQTAYVLIVVAYAMQGIEAFVDAHLQDFDIDEDLSLKVQPKLQFLSPQLLGAGPLPTLSLTLQW